MGKKCIRRTPLTRLLILVEGQTEEAFVKLTLKPYLESFGIYVQNPIVLWTKREVAGNGYRGGASNWSQIQKSLNPLLKDSDAWITTILDYYGLPDDLPGYCNAVGIKSPHERVFKIQEELKISVNHKKFIPFISLHEFEAWLFSSPKTVAEHFAKNNIENEMQKIIDEVGNPELINHGKDTHPKARLENIINEYKERTDGPNIINKCGIEKIMTICPHFSNWIKSLQEIKTIQ